MTVPKKKTTKLQLVPFMREVIIGTRGSSLALWQAEFIRQTLKERFEIKLTIKIISTQGDIDQSTTFTQMEGTGFFTKALEAALIREEIDIAVHSLKDLMTTMPDQLSVPVVGFREDRRELLLIDPRHYVEGLLPVKDGTVIGTSSARRKSQLKYLNKNLNIRDIRGNLPTRLNKLRNGEYGAILIAAAGINRLAIDLSDFKSVLLDPQFFLPAPGQGVLAVQSRRDDGELNRLLKQIDDHLVRTEVEMERGLLKKFNRGCSLPLGVFTEIEESRLCHLKAVLDISENSRPQLRRADISGTDPEQIVNDAFNQLTKEKVTIPCDWA